MTLALSRYAGSHAWLVESRPGVFPLPAPGCPALVPFAGAGSPVFGPYAAVRPLVVSDKNPRLVNVYSSTREDVDAVLEHLSSLVEDWRDRLAGLAGAERDEQGRLFFEGVRSALDEGPTAPTSFARCRRCSKAWTCGARTSA